jgi:DNA-binding NarL/FixJ family response regulator
VDLLPIFSNNCRRYPSAASWVLSSEIRLSAGCASARRLMLLGFFSLALNKQRLAFMVTTEQDALEGLARARPGLLIASNQLEQGSGLALVEQARALVEDIRTILIVDAQQDDLVAAGLSSADAVLAEADCFTEAKPVIALSRSLALGRRYRSPSVQAALEAAAVDRAPWRDEPPQLSPRELEILAMLVEGSGDREIGDCLGISYEAARSRSKALRRKLGAGNRVQLVAKALQLGLGRLTGG